MNPATSPVDDAAPATEAEGAWYVVHTKPRQERIAQTNLVRQGFSVYLPKLKVLKCVRDQRVIRYEPFFPRYLFFQPAHRGQSIAPVRSTTGVVSIVKFGVVPAVLPPSMLENIRVLERERDAADIIKLSGLKPGRTVIVTSGPLAGLPGMVAMVAKDRVTVLMHLLGGDSKVKLRPEALRLAA